MEYTEGSYIISGRKNWICEKCKKPIFNGKKHFARVKEVSEPKKRSDGKLYTEKKYYRYHLKCALSLNNLSNKEINLIENPQKKQIDGKNLPESKIQTQIQQYLKKCQDKKLLTFLHVVNGMCSFKGVDHPYKFGNKGFSDFVVFLPNKIYFIEVKLPHGSMSPDQVYFMQFISELGYSYQIVNSVNEVKDFIAPHLYRIAPRSHELVKNGK